MQNCNSTPFLLTSEGNPDPKNFPKYMVQEGDNLRGEMSRRILSQNKKFTFDGWRRAAFDTTVLGADKYLPSMLSALKKRIDETNDQGTQNLRDAYDELLKWNHRSATESVAMTLFSLWRGRIEDNKPADDKSRAAALAAFASLLGSASVAQAASHSGRVRAITGAQARWAYPLAP